MPSPIDGMSRRDLLRLISTVGAAAAFGIADNGATVANAVPTGLSSRPINTSGLVRRAASAKAHGSDLGAVEHVVFLMMENRSYDHFFGAYPRGRGFDDHPKHSLGAFEQDYPAGTGLHPKKRLLPFELTEHAGGFCTNDLTHDFGPMHQCWNHGRMNHFVKVHTSSQHEGSVDGAMTMGYYTRKQLSFYWSLADNFTLGDGYHASILGPTHPNRLMANSGTIDPAGKRGGPITDTSGNPDVRYTCTWSTVQEHLEDAGVSWKVYHPSYADVSSKYAHLASYETWNPVIYNPTANPAVMLASDHVLPYFKNFESPASSLYQKAFNPTFPNEFVSDVNGHTLPSVSWIIPPLGFDDHPSASPQHGQYFVQLVLDALMADKETWSKTVLFLMYDENDGWSDHVSPPTAPRGTPGEWLTAKTISSECDGIRGPLGLGVRVPLLVLSPFARGGHIANEVFDHTSQLKFLHERFGVDVPNVSDWRKRHVGDLTSTLFRSKKDNSKPHLPVAPLPPQQTSGSCSEETQDTEQGGAHPDIPTHQRMPRQGEPPVSVEGHHHHHRGGHPKPLDGDAVKAGRIKPVAGKKRGPRSSTAKSETQKLLSTSTNPLR